MYSLIIILLICIILFIYFYNYSNNIPNTNTINTTTIQEFNNVKMNIKPSNENNEKIKMIIFVATWCGACNSYKKNIHQDLSKELKKMYNNIEFEFIVDDPKNEEIKNLQKYFEIKYFPTIILYKNDNYKLLPMNESITSGNIVKLIDSIN